MKGRPSGRNFLIYFKNTFYIPFPSFWGTDREIQHYKFYTRPISNSKHFQFQFFWRWRHSRIFSPTLTLMFKAMQRCFCCSVEYFGDKDTKIFNFWDPAQPEMSLTKKVSPRNQQGRLINNNTPHNVAFSLRDSIFRNPTGMPESVVDHSTGMWRWMIYRIMFRSTCYRLHRRHIRMFLMIITITIWNLYCGIRMVSRRSIRRNYTQGISYWDCPAHSENFHNSSQRQKFPFNPHPASVTVD